MKIIFSLWMLIIVISFYFPDGNAILNFTTLIVWIVTVLLLFKRDSKFSMVSLFFIISFTVVSLSCLVAESGAFFSEIKQLSYLTGAVTRNLSLSSILILFSFQTYKILHTMIFFRSGMPIVLNEIFKRVIVFTVLLSNVVLIGIYIKYGTPNDYNVDRFYYWSNIAPAWGGYFKFILIQMAIFLGLFYSYRMNKAYLVIFLISLISQVLVGEKLTGLYISVIFFVIPIVVNRNLSVLRLLLHPKSILIICVGCVLLFFIILASYNSLAGKGSGLDLFLNRLVLQSQMWWAVDNISNQQISLSNVLTHMLGFSSSSDEDTGIYYLMSRIADPATFYWFYDKGITFTMASPVNFIYFFGPYWCYIAILPLAAILGFTIHVLVKSIELNDIILIFFTLKLFYIIIRVVTMGEVHLIFGYKFVIILLLLLFYMLQVSRGNFSNA
ncbi:TPA: hypothetical protein I3998_003144 [Enterobacter cloacae]|uniref:DUF6418 domain-containing protein n=2 Tax=Enterobacter cloacae TaxID=550 RepID=UPI0007352742|nr:DUF6418 domain-containing protein [Enterobacter cloacae]KTH74897.1 hypothetical protein ASV19_00680 [Enterobacter cloacae subsp. cloacae]HAS1239162.1 hypothetical protein [Enterobacter cloacae]HED1597529.1 hypothetical protein [Enterobacter cloacae subsp. cloacae]HED2540641.1 hypothetical protein [Enterobacter cloacae subsp. cloacae]